MFPDSDCTILKVIENGITTFQDLTAFFTAALNKPLKIETQSKKRKILKFTKNTISTIFEQFLNETE